MFLWKKKTPTAPPITVYIMYLCAYCPKHSSRESITSMTMAMGPAKLQMSLSSMEIQQKSGFPYPSGSSPTARPAAKRKTVRSESEEELYSYTAHYGHGNGDRQYVMVCCILHYSGSKTKRDTAGHLFTND